MYSYVPVCYWYVARMYSYVLVCTRMLLVCTCMCLYVTRMYSYVLVWCFSHDPILRFSTKNTIFLPVIHSTITKNSFLLMFYSYVYTRVLPVCYWYVSRMYSYVARMYSYVFVCYSYVLVFYSYVLVWCFSHNPTQEVG